MYQFCIESIENSLKKRIKCGKMQKKWIWAPVIDCCGYPRVPTGSGHMTRYPTRHMTRTLTLGGSLYPWHSLDPIKLCGVDACSPLSGVKLGKTWLRACAESPAAHFVSHTLLKSFVNNFLYSEYITKFRLIATHFFFTNLHILLFRSWQNWPHMWYIT